MPRAFQSHVLSLGFALTVAVVLGGTVATWSRAEAAVSHELGYAATVDGFTSWYGSYEMGELGTAWCIDHGSRAPDPALGYEPTEVTDQPAATRTALAWALESAAPGAGADGHESRVDSAALMLALHDLMGAVYPSGPLDVDALPVSALAGFGADAGAVLARARSIKAEATSHAGLVGPYVLTVEVPATAAGEDGELTVRVTDSAGLAVAGARIELAATVAVLSSATATTGADGSVSVGFTAGRGLNRFDASATLPDLELHAFASTSTPAQRVTVPATVTATAHADIESEVPWGGLLVSKIDARTNEPLSGAVLDVSTGGTSVATVRTTTEAVRVGRLRPGEYVVSEVEAPPGYAPAAAVTVTVERGELTEVVVADRPAGGVEFQKTSAGPPQHAAGATFAGATFTVSAEATGEEVGRCTTGSEGHCAVTGAVLTLGDQYCWQEIVAPRGWAAAPGECFTAEVAMHITVEEPSTATAVVGDKTDAVTGQPVEGAVYQLFRRGAAGDEVLVGEATSDAAGVVGWPAQLPGWVYCARERLAPAAYELDPIARCTDHALVAGEPGHIGLPDRPRPALPETGWPAGAVALVGAGLVALGTAAVRSATVLTWRDTRR